MRRSHSGSGLAAPQPAAVFKDRDLALRFPEFLVVEHPDMRQFADRGWPE
jgi:hypothetical protein